MVVEAIVENKDIKAALYRQLDAILPAETILASNTSFLNIFEIMPEARLPYTVIAHWYAPPQLVPLVEVVRNERTLQPVVDTVMELLRMGGKNLWPCRNLFRGILSTECRCV
jgi:3-hydroxybutyryl-CoA dehydrogenase